MSNAERVGRKPKFRVGQVVKYRHAKRWHYFRVTRVRISSTAYWYMDDEGYVTIQRRLRPLTKRETGR